MGEILTGKHVVFSGSIKYKENVFAMQWIQILQKSVNRKYKLNTCHMGKKFITFFLQGPVWKVYFSIIWSAVQKVKTQNHNIVW